MLTGKWTFQLLVMPCQQRGWGDTKSWEGTQPGQVTQTNPRNILYHMTSWSAIKLGGEAWGQGTAIAQGLAEHQLDGGEQLRCTSLTLCILFFFFSSPLSLLLNCPKLMSFVLFFHASLPLVCMSEWMVVWCLTACWVKLQHVVLWFSNKKANQWLMKLWPSSLLQQYVAAYFLRNINFPLQIFMYKYLCIKWPQIEAQEV